MLDDITGLTDDAVKARYLESIRTATLGAGFWQAVYAERLVARAERRLERLTWAIVGLTLLNAVLVGIDVLLVLTRSSSG